MVIILLPFLEVVIETTTGDCTPPLVVKALLKAFLSCRALDAEGVSVTRTSCRSFRLGAFWGVFFWSCLVVWWEGSDVPRVDPRGGIAQRAFGVGGLLG